jgi:hypothetical protein
MNAEQFIQALKVAVESIPPGYKVVAVYQKEEMGFMANPPGGVRCNVQVLPVQAGEGKG